MSRKTKEETEKTRESILTAALDVLCEKGYSQATFVDIADRIGMTKGAVYWHFKDKPTLLVAMINSVRSQEETALKVQLSELSTLDDLRAYMVARMRLATETEPFKKFTFFMTLQMEWSAGTLTMVHEELEQARIEPFVEVEQVLERAESVGALQTGTDVQESKDILLGMYFGLLMVHLHGLGNSNPVDALDTAIGVFLDSIRK